MEDGSWEIFCGHLAWCCCKKWCFIKDSMLVWNVFFFFIRLLLYNFFTNLLRHNKLRKLYYVVVSFLYVYTYIFYERQRLTIGPINKVKFFSEQVFINWPHQRQLFFVFGFDGGLGCFLLLLVVLFLVNNTN